MSFKVPEDTRLNRFLMQLDHEDREHVLSNFDEEVRQARARKQKKISKQEHKKKVCE